LGRALLAKPDRPALKRLLADIERGQVDVVVVYKIDRLSRSLMDFAKLVEVFEARSVRRQWPLSRRG
jgi:DNA invertase Pin-like site-specific DNA recombinase